MAPRIITDVKSFVPDYLPSNIESFRDWLNDQIDKIPEEFRKNSSIRINGPFKIEINTMRYETDAERKKREVKIQKVKELYELTKKTKLKKERAQYEKLRKKFEKPSG